MANLKLMLLILLQIGRKREVVRQLPPVGIDEGISVQKSGGDEVHVFAHPEEKSRHSREKILIKKVDIDE